MRPESHIYRTMQWSSSASIADPTAVDSISSRISGKAKDPRQLLLQELDNMAAEVTGSWIAKGVQQNRSGDSSLHKNADSSTKSIAQVAERAQKRARIESVALDTSRHAVSAALIKTGIVASRGSFKIDRRFCLLSLATSIQPHLDLDSWGGTFDIGGPDGRQDEEVEEVEGQEVAPIDMVERGGFIFYRESTGGKIDYDEIDRDFTFRSEMRKFEQDEQERMNVQMLLLEELRATAESQVRTEEHERIRELEMSRFGFPISEWEHINKTGGSHGDGAVPFNLPMTERIQAAVVADRNDIPEFLPKDLHSLIDTYFSSSFYEFYFSVASYLLNGMSVSQAQALLLDLRRIFLVHSPQVASYLTHDMTTMRKHLLRIPFLRPRDQWIRGDGQPGVSPVFSIPAVLARALADPLLCATMNFDVPDAPFSGNLHTRIGELFESPEYSDTVRRTGDSQVPLVLELFYDDFAKYRCTSGESIGGFYLAIGNMSREELSKPENLFLVSLVRKEDNVNDVLRTVIQDLHEATHQGELQLYHGGFKKWLRFRLFISLQILDMPQRHDNAQMKRQTSTWGGCFHCNCPDFLLHADPSELTLAQIAPRTTESMKALFEEWTKIRQEETQQAADQFQQLHGTNFNERGNPLWELLQTFHFDVHRNTPPDYFHVEVSPTSSSSIFDNLQKQKQKQNRERERERERDLMTMYDRHALLFVFQNVNIRSLASRDGI